MQQGSADEMKRGPKELEIECHRAAEELLALNWGNTKPRVRAAVAEMLAGSKALQLVHGVAAELPVQAEPARRLNDLVVAITALRVRQSQLKYVPSPEQECGAT